MSTESPKQEFTIQQIYIKDFSYEAPGTPRIFQDDWKPEVKLDLNIAHEKLDNDTYEVVLRLTVTAKQTAKAESKAESAAEPKVLFLVEVKQAGIFTMKGISSADLEQLFAVLCPTILFPYAREAISSMIAKGGFPAVFLAPINFEVLFLKHKSDQQLLATETAGSA